MPLTEHEKVVKPERDGDNYVPYFDLMEMLVGCGGCGLVMKFKELAEHAKECPANDARDD
jgi:hypothetical protein